MSVETDIYQGLIAETETIVGSAFRVSYPGVEFNPANAETYVEIRQFKNTNGNPTWGRDKILRGIWQLSLIVTGSENPGALMPTEITSTIADHFHKNKRIQFGATVIVIPENPTELTEITEPSKTIYPVSIPYQVLNRNPA